MPFKERRGQEGILQGPASCIFRITTSPNLAYSHAALRFVSRSMVPCVLRLVLQRLGWVTAAGGRLVPDHHRCVDSQAELRCQESLDSLVDAGGCWAVKKFPAPESAQAAIGARSGLASGSPAPGHAAAAVRALDRRTVAQRVRAAAVTRMYQRGRLAPLPGIRVNGGVVKAASGSAPVTCGQ
jgi:hypothetical protein